MRKCTRCEVEKPECDFDDARARSATGKASYCAQCRDRLKEYRRSRPVVAASEKECGKCRVKKKASEFHKDSGALDGLYRVCRSCAAVAHIEKYNPKRSPQEIDASGRYRCDGCGKFYKKSARADRRQCNPCLRSARIASVGVEKLRRRARDAYAKDPARFIARVVASAKPGRAERSVAIAERADGTLTKDAVKTLFASAKTCPYCSKQMRGKGKSLDHVIPIARGGSHSLANVLICCRSCNSAKGALAFDEWLARVQERHGDVAAARARKAYETVTGRDNRQGALSFGFTNTRQAKGV